MSLLYFLKRLLSACFLLCLFTAQMVLAQGSGKVIGTISDKISDDVLAGANIIVQGTSFGAAADLDGKYFIRNVPAGKYTIEVSYIGYYSVSSSVTVIAGKTVEKDFQLEPQVIQGQTVEVTAQAQGQISAIQQQLTSDKIANIVSEMKIQELPDFNAAQAISRLSGVSTLESSGEANKVVIRGLAPQYNQITIGGMSLASTGSSQIGVTSQGTTSGMINNDRSVDLSMMSPYMIKTISLYKALTPDLNANAIGGVVNMELREAPPDFHTDLLWQSGYTQKSNTYGNYRAVGSVSSRFWDDIIGVYALGNIESYDRNADNMDGAYIVTDSKKIGDNGFLPVRVSNIQLNRHIETRQRFGGNLILDYKLPTGSVKLINMFSRLNSDYKDYRTIYDYQTNDLNFRFRGGDNDIDIAVNSLNIMNDFGFMQLDLKAANNYSRNNLPTSPEFQFTQTRGVQSSTENTIPEDLLNLVSFSGPQSTYLTNVSLYSSDYKENNQAYKGDLKFPLTLANIAGYFKFGGEFQYKHHKNNQETPYASLRGGSNIQNLIVTGLLSHYPQLQYDSTTAYFPASNFTSSDQDLLDTFLDNRFGNMLWASNTELLTDITNYLSASPEFSADSATAVQPGGWFNGYFQKLPNDYKYIERYYAGYLMSELNYGNLMVVGGLRYEKVKTLYSAFLLKDGRDTKTQTFYPVTVYPKNEFWLPMVQARYNVTDWFDIRYAYTQTLARPDYHQLTPFFSMGYSRNTVRSGNPNLKPAHAYNHDVIVTFHSNELGLFSIGGFYKIIKDFTYSTQYPLYNSAPAGLDSIGSFNIGGVSPLTGAILYTYINTPYLAYVKGVELDFQTRLWYLPTPLNGIVLGINYTRISSEATYPWRDSRSDYSVRPPKTEVFDSTRTGRLIYQPDNILNAYVGYDFAGFSARLSFVFQGNSVSYVGNFPEQDGFTRDYFRMDASVRQILPLYGIELYLDLNNLNNRSNIAAQKSIGGFTNEKNYGLTGNIGLRFRI